MTDTIVTTIYELGLVATASGLPRGECYEQLGISSVDPSSDEAKVILSGLIVRGLARIESGKVELSTDLVHVATCLGSAQEVVTLIASGEAGEVVAALYVAADVGSIFVEPGPGDVLVAVGLDPSKDLREHGVDGAIGVITDARGGAVVLATRWSATSDSKFGAVIESLDVGWSLKPIVDGEVSSFPENVSEDGLRGRLTACFEFRTLPA